MLPADGNGPRALRCLACDKFDPIKLPANVGWIEGELRPLKQGVFRVRFAVLFPLDLVRELSLIGERSHPWRRERSILFRTRIEV